MCLLYQELVSIYHHNKFENIFVYFIMTGFLVLDAIKFIITLSLECLPDGGWHVIIVCHH